MSISELMKIFVNDKELMNEFIILLACTVSMSTVAFFCVANVLIDLLEKPFRKIRNYYRTKRYGRLIGDTIDCAYLLAQNGTWQRAKAELIEDALLDYAKRKKVSTRSPWSD